MNKQEIEYLSGLHRKILGRLDEDVTRLEVFRPLYLYALDKDYLPGEAITLIERNLDEILSWGNEFRCAEKWQEGESIGKLGCFPLVLILYHIYRFYCYSNGSDIWNAIRDGVGSASSFGLVLGCSIGLGKRKQRFLCDMMKEYGEKLILNDTILKALFIHDDQMGYEAYDYGEFFRYHCPFLKAENQGQAAARLKVNERVFNCIPAELSLTMVTWTEICERDDSGEWVTDCRRIARDIIEQCCGDQPQVHDNGRLHPVCGNSYVHALLKYAPMEYFLSLKALCSDDGEGGKATALEKWPWLEELWGQGKLCVDFSWRLHYVEKDKLDFLLCSSLEETILLKQGDVKGTFYRPQIDREYLARVRFDLSKPIDVYSPGGAGRKIGCVDPLPERAAYLLPEHPGKCKTGRDLLKSRADAPILFQRRLYLVGRQGIDIDSIADEKGNVLPECQGTIRLKGYNVKLILLNEPTLSTTISLFWGADQLYIHMPLRPQIQDSNGYDDRIQICRYKGSLLPYCIQKISTDDIQQADPDELRRLLLPDEEDRLPFLSYTARLAGEGMGAATVSLQTEIRKDDIAGDFRRLGNDFNIYRNDDGYLIEKLINGVRGSERYFISHRVPNLVTVTCRLSTERQNSLDRCKSCLILPPDWRERYARAAAARECYQAARRCNECYLLEVGTKEVTLECRMTEQSSFILKDMVSPVEGCANEGTAPLHDLSVHVLPVDHEEDLNIKRAGFVLTWGDSNRVTVAPEYGQDLQSLFCSADVPYGVYCELWQEGRRPLYKGRFIPGLCCATREAVYIPGIFVGHVRISLFYEDNIWHALKEQAVNLSDLREIGTAIPKDGTQVGFYVLLESILDNYFSEWVTKSGWYKLEFQFDNATVQASPCFFHGDKNRTLSDKAIRGFRNEEGDEWPELADEIRKLAANAEEPAVAEPELAPHYSIHADFVRNFESIGWGYIDRDGHFTRCSQNQIPLKGFFKVTTIGGGNGETMNVVKHEYYSRNRLYFRYAGGRYRGKVGERGAIIHPDFSFAKHTYAGWQEEHVVQIIEEDWLSPAVSSLVNLQYGDLRTFGQKLGLNARLLDPGRDNLFKDGWSVLFQITKYLFYRERRAHASLMLLSLYLVMKSRNGIGNLAGCPLKSRLEAFELTLTRDEIDAVSKCMNLTYWIVTHF